MLLQKLLHYLNPANFFSKNRESNINLRMMHGVNRLSIFMFLFCLAVMLIRSLLR